MANTVNSYQTPSSYSASSSLENFGPNEASHNVKLDSFLVISESLMLNLAGVFEDIRNTKTIFNSNLRQNRMRAKINHSFYKNKKRKLMEDAVNGIIGEYWMRVPKIQGIVFDSKGDDSSRAWCPQSPIKDEVREWLQLEFDGLKVIDLLITWGLSSKKFKNTGEIMHPIIRFKINGLIYKIPQLSEHKSAVKFDQFLVAYNTDHPLDKISNDSYSQKRFKIVLLSTIITPSAYPSNTASLLLANAGDQSACAFGIMTANARLCP
ncbi:hypothetical protein ACTXT7_009051 [Hymenolepis weldensis]